MTLQAKIERLSRMYNMKHSNFVNSYAQTLLYDINVKWLIHSAIKYIIYINILYKQLEQEILRYLISNNKILKEDMDEYQKLNTIINKIGNIDTIIDENMEDLPLSTLGQLMIYENDLHDTNSLKRLINYITIL